MNTPNAEPLTEKKAEAVLLVRTAPLVWDNSFREQGQAVVKQGLELYSVIRLEPFGECYLVVWSRGNVNTRHPRNFHSNADARTACERHHTTGKWGG